MSTTAASTPLGITLGDPTGIGPELLVRVLAEPGLRGTGPGADRPVIVYGDAGILASVAADLHLPWPPPGVRVLGVTSLSREQAPPGQPTRHSGAAQLAYLEAALQDAAQGTLGGLCTAPIHKASALAAGLGFPGHTELLAHRLAPRPDEVVMMLAGPSLRVTLCTTHLALAQVPAALSVDRVALVILQTVRFLHEDLGLLAPRVLVAGLNPHAGEDGHFGQEEALIIAPALAAVRAHPAMQGLLAQGLDLSGPWVPDVVFRAAVQPPPGQKRADAVVCMYHDQGLIPLKLLDFDEGVNVTLGLPLPRTSPDHGVAHDIAGRYQARPQSMAAALRLCAQIADQRGGWRP